MNPTTWYFVMRATLGATVMTLPSQGHTKLQVEATVDWPAGVASRNTTSRRGYHSSIERTGTWA